MTDDLRNNGFVAGLAEARRGRRLQATRRGFMRSTLIAASAATAASFAGLFGPARRVEAQTGIVGSYPRRIATYCPPLNSNDNCQPGCGSSPICTDCCSGDGFFRNDPGNGYSLYPGGCGDGDIADGWLWRFAGVCGSCATIEYRCSDGYVQTDTGPAPFICRAVTACEPLAEGAEPGENLPDASRSTNWRPAGRLELATDNGGTMTIRGWIADSTRQPVQMRITANGAIVHFGTAALPRPDIAQTVRGSGPNTGYAVSFPIEPGDYEICVDALSGPLNSRMGCVNLRAGSGAAVRGSGGSSSVPGAAQPTAEPTTEQSPEPTPDGAPTTAPAATATSTPTAEPTPTVGEIVFPDQDTSTATIPSGALQVLRRSSATTAFVSGWAADFDTTEAAFIDVVVDGESVGRTRTDLPRPDVAKTFPGLGPDTGFALTVDIPNDAATVCVDIVDPQDGRRRSLGCRTLGATIDDGAATAAGPPTATGETRPAPTMVYGDIDAIAVDETTATINGWAFSTNPDETAVTIAVNAAGITRTTMTDRDHPGTSDIYALDHAAGFELSVVLPPGDHVLQLLASTDTAAQRVLTEQTVTIP